MPPFGEATDITAGHGFNYAVWTANTRVSFHNVPWNSDYRDLVHYDTQAKLDVYLETVAGPVFTMTTYAKVNEPVRVNLPHNMCYKYNYLRVYNPAEPLGAGVDEPRVFYYFIKDVRFLAPNTTELVVQLDVWQTFSRYLEFGNCYIERGHIGIANKDAFKDHGRAYLTVPEGLDCGNEYVTTYALEYELASTKTYNVLVSSTTNLTAAPGTVSDPAMDSATGSGFEGLPNGMNLYLFKSIQEFTGAMLRMSGYPWVAQGIISIMLVPDVYTALAANAGNTVKKIPGDGFGQNALELTTGTVPGKTIKTENFRDHFVLPDRYARLLKFKTFPYSVMEKTTYQGSPLLLKPECIATDSHFTRIVMHLAPPSPRIVIYPLKYNGKEYANDDEAMSDVRTEDGTPALNDRSDFLDLATGIFDLPMFSIVNNGYLSYMASNVNRINYAYQNADWSQSRAMAGVQLGYNQATAGLNNAMGQALNNNQAMYSGASMLGGIARARGGVNAMTNTAGGLVRGALGGGGAGAALGGLNSVAGSMQDVASAELDYMQQMGMAGIEGAKNTANMFLNRGTAQYLRDTNADYGNFAARGDYANEIAAINARVQDARLIQPTTSGQSGGEAFSLAVHKWGIFTKYKMLQPAVMAAIGELWLRYGYAINRFGRMPKSFQVMERFTYWKLRESYITSAAMPEAYKQTIRGIFEKGVTVWTNPSDIGNIDIADNAPLPGVEL